MRDIIYERILKFRDAVFTYSGWKNLIEDEDVNGKCGVRFIHDVKLKAKYLYHALNLLLAKKEAEPLLTWQDICELAIKKVKEFEGATLLECIENNNNENTHHWVGARTIMRWFRQYRDNHESLVNTPYQRSLIDNDPKSFSLNPELKHKFISYAKANIQGLTGEVLLDHFHDTIIPELIEEEKCEMGFEITKDELLRQYGLTKLCLGTIYKWMHHFGFKYSVSKKTYYVDGHERPEVVAYRKKYVTEYLQDELRCFRWIQLSNEEVEELEDNDSEFDRKIGYEYRCNDTGRTFFEFHVDDHQTFHDKFDESTFGGNLSVRKIVRIGLSL